MAGNGPAPKKDAVRRNKAPEFTQLVEDGSLRGPELPEGWLEGGEEWHPATQRWWNNWRRSPQATRMLSAPDWDYLLDTALMHHTMWAKGRWEFASEVRLRVAKFGATPDDRNRLRAEIVLQPEVDDSALEGGVVSMSSHRARKDRLLGE